MAKKMRFESKPTKGGRIQYNDALHRYTIDGRGVPSVTKIIAGNIDDYLFRSPNLIAAGNFGTRIHDHVHDINIGKRTLHVEHGEKFYLEQVKAFYRAEKMKPVGSELLLYSLTFKYAGRCDVVCEDEKGRLWIVDWKTGQVQPYTGLQLAGYAFAFREIFKKKIHGRMAVKLTAESYRTIKFTERTDEAVFLAKLTSLRWDIANMGREI